jgi:hypothetical protein
MNDVTEKKWASALFNGDFYLIETYSGYRGSSRDENGKQHTLDPNADANSLGSALMDALLHSRFLTLAELDDFFDYRKNQQSYEAWVQALITKHGYKSKNALFKKMACCNITVNVADGTMEICPMRHEKLEGWGREKDDGIENVIIPANSSEAVVGDALRLAFSRCI